MTMMPTPPVIIQPMSVQDVPIIEVLEAACFPEPWSGDVYRHELAHNRLSSYWVMRPAAAIAGVPPILAYGGFWAMGPEVHIVTVATHPEYRRQGLARKLMVAMIAQAQVGGALEVTLEVRAGNHAAQALYAQMGFLVVGRRKGYYRDNGEDAILMTLFLPESTVAPVDPVNR